MENKKATEVKCPTCNKNPKILIYEKGVFIFGGTIFILSIYGLVSLIRDLISFF
jgi:hypothetical protein